MIVVDTSALVAIAWNEPPAPRLRAVLNGASEGAISAATYVEFGMVLGGRRKVGVRYNLAADIEDLLSACGIEVAPVDLDLAKIALAARLQYGRGSGHAAKLNYGDCFSYALAKSLNAPLLFIGNGFSKTDIKSAL